MRRTTPSHVPSSTRSLIPQNLAPAGALPLTDAVLLLDRAAPCKALLENRPHLLLLLFGQLESLLGLLRAGVELPAQLVGFGPLGLLGRGRARGQPEDTDRKDHQA